jgi:hypothetical protein
MFYGVQFYVRLILHFSNNQEQRHKLDNMECEKFNKCLDNVNLDISTRFN